MKDDRFSEAIRQLARGDELISAHLASDRAMPGRTAEQVLEAMVISMAERNRWLMTHVQRLLERQPPAPIVVPVGWAGKP